MNNNDLIHDLSKEAFQYHVILDSEARSFAFIRKQPVVTYDPETHKENAKFRSVSAYHFKITWTPGNLVLTGDLGELVLVQPHALGTFDEAIEWACTSDYDYMLSKSNVKKTYDPQATYNELVRRANYDAIEEMNGQLNWSGRKDDGIRQKLAKIRRAKKALISNNELNADEQDALIATIADEFEPNELHPLIRLENKKIDYRKTTLEVVADSWFIAQGWANWVAYWAVLLGHDYNGSDPDHLPTYVLKARNRNKLKQELFEICQDERALYDFLCETGIHVDYYGSYTYPHETRWQYEAIKFGCNAIMLNIQKQKKRRRKN